MEIPLPLDGVQSKPSNAESVQKASMDHIDHMQRIRDHKLNTLQEMHNKIAAREELHHERILQYLKLAKEYGRDPFDPNG